MAKAKSSLRFSIAATTSDGQPDRLAAPATEEKVQSINDELSTVSAGPWSKREKFEVTNDLSSLQDSMDIAVIFLDRDFRIRRFTPPVSDLLELIPSDIGRPLIDLALKFHDARLFDHAHEVVEKHLPMCDEVTSLSGRVYLRRVLPDRSKDDQVDGVVITFVEITELRQAEAALRESEHRNRVILEGIREYAIFMLDAHGRITTWNAAAERILGYSQREALGQPLASLVATDAADIQPAQQIERAANQGFVDLQGWHLRKDGSRFWGTGSLSALPDRSGKITGYVKVLRDNTEQKLAEEAMKQARRAAEAANESKDQFLANVSHELRTPLSAIVLWTSLIEDHKVIDRTQLAEAITAIKRSAEEQRELIEDLVDTSRIVAGKLRLEIHQVELPNVVRAGIETARGLATEKNITLEESFDPQVNVVEADGARIKQVVGNLVNNSVKFTPSGGKISVELSRTGDEVQIAITDSGIGMTKEFLPQIFDRFSQVEDASTRTQSGLGLGLAIARQIVEMHRGSIVVESEGVGRGSKFTVRLPLPSIEGQAIAASSIPSAQITGVLKGRRVLLIEDVATTRRALTAVLQEAGAEVDPVDSAPAAWEAIELRRPDVIVSDLGLPTIDGYAFMRQVRETESMVKTPPIPAIALTAFAGENVKQKALNNGFQVCLTKPIEPVHLVTSVASLVSARP